MLTDAEIKKQEDAAKALAPHLVKSYDKLRIRMIEELVTGEVELVYNTAIAYFDAEILQWWDDLPLGARTVYVIDPQKLFEECCAHFFKKKDRKKVNLVDQYIEDWNLVEERLKVLMFVKKEKEPYNLIEEYNLI